LAAFVDEEDPGIEQIRRLMIAKGKHLLSVAPALRIFLGWFRQVGYIELSPRIASAKVCLRRRGDDLWHDFCSFLLAP
jgi:hypothetical protein